MQFLCEKCGTRYSVPDERVRGKRVRTKCRKCGSDILVEGPGTDGARAAPSVAPGAPARTDPVPTPSVAPPAPGGERWTVALSRADRRKMTTGELIDAIAGGTVNEKVLVWKRGMDRWQAPAEVPTLALALGARGPSGRSAPVTARPPEPGAEGRATPAAPASAVAEPTPAAPPVSATAESSLAASPGLGGFTFDDEATAVIAPDRARELLEAEAAKLSPPSSETPLSFGFDDEATQVVTLDRAGLLLRGGAEAGGDTALPSPGFPAPRAPPVEASARGSSREGGARSATGDGAPPSVVVAPSAGPQNGPVGTLPSPPPSAQPAGRPGIPELDGIQFEPTRVIQVTKRGAGAAFWAVFFLAVAAAIAGGSLASGLLRPRSPAPAPGAR
jgi:predicted Zn finger-like uncharacterized protein